jgi:hypothetical protein
VLTLLFLLHCENRDFSILMKDILSFFFSSIGSHKAMTLLVSCCVCFGLAGSDII